MMYPFMTLNDGTEVVHSEAYLEDGKEKQITNGMKSQLGRHGGFEHASNF